MRKLWITRFLTYLPLVASMPLMWMDPTEGYWRGIGALPFTLLLIGYIMADILITLLGEHQSIIYFWQSWKAKPVYSKYGTYYLIPFRNSERFVVCESRYFFMYNISQKVSKVIASPIFVTFTGEPNDEFIDGINKQITRFISIQGDKNKSKKLFNSWHGYLDKQLMRDEKLKSLKVDKETKI